MMENGEISDIGTFEELKSQNESFSLFVQNCPAQIESEIASSKVPVTPVTENVSVKKPTESKQNNDEKNIIKKENISS